MLEISVVAIKVGANSVDVAGFANASRDIDLRAGDTAPVTTLVKTSITCDGAAGTVRAAGCTGASLHGDLGALLAAIAILETGLAMERCALTFVAAGGAGPPTDLNGAAWQTVCPPLVKTGFAVS